MAEIHIKNFEQPDEVVSMPGIRGEIVVVAETSVGRFVHAPGWRWSQDIRPIVGTQYCQYHHQGYVVSGELHVVTDNGAARTLRAGDVFDIPPGHDAWVLGDEPFVTVEFRGARDWARPYGHERVLATLLFTDVVNSTTMAMRLGDVAWKALLSRHYERVRAEFDRFRGYEVRSTGDGYLAVFDGPARAIRCAEAICVAAREQGIAVRAGVHTGEIEQHPEGIYGVSVHIAARIMTLAGAGEVLISGSTVALLDGAGLSFEDAGEHELKGVDGLRRIYRLAGGPPLPAR